ncbi:MAG TPA: L-lactate dehydrogenase, partial [Clostridiaceae bacterium]|nr:L-lactate dehydrogenase [Clostridiaceae bacterium]
INDVALSMPCIINSNGIDRVLEITLDDLELKELKTSAEKIKEVLKQVEDI